MAIADDRLAVRHDDRSPLDRLESLGRVGIEQRLGRRHPAQPARKEHLALLGHQQPPDARHAKEARRAHQVRDPAAVGRQVEERVAHDKRVACRRIMRIEWHLVAELERIAGHIEWRHAVRRQYLLARRLDCNLEFDLVELFPVSSPIINPIINPIQSNPIINPIQSSISSASTMM